MKIIFKAVYSLLAVVIVLSSAISPVKAKAEDNISGLNFQINETNVNRQSDDIAQLAPYMNINDEGFLILDNGKIAQLKSKVRRSVIKQVQSAFFKINDHLKQIPLSDRPHVVKNAQGEIQIQFEGLSSPADKIRRCVFVPNWVLVWMGWMGIIYGGGLVTAGLFAGGTVWGIPAGALLGAVGLWVGITGSFLIWYADKYYPKGKKVCWGK